MNAWLKRILTITLIVTSLSTLIPAAHANLSPSQSTAILTEFSKTSVTDFRQFLTLLKQNNQAEGDDLGLTISAFLAGKPLSVEQQNQVYRLLGLYARLKYGGAAIETLGDLVAIPTFHIEGVPTHENPEFVRFAATLKDLAQAFNLEFRNIDNRVYEISLGTGKEVVGIHAHADVAPAILQNWLYDPFKVTQIGNRMYGRGTENDKNAIVVALYAMKVIKEEHLPLTRGFKLLVNTTEANTDSSLAYYFERNPTPKYNMALDGVYPVVIAEKGYGTVTASFARRTAQGTGAEITSMAGSFAVNEVPLMAVALLAGEDPAQLAASLQRAGDDYAKRNGDNFRVATQVVGQQVKLTVTGVPTHAFEPEAGVNPVARLLGFIHSLDGQIPLKGNHITDAARYAADNWGLDYLGGKLGIGFSDAFMGPLTTSPTAIETDEKTLKLTVNLRVPKGKPAQALSADIAAKLGAWTKQSGISATFDYSISEPMYHAAENEWVKTLLAVANENLGTQQPFGSDAGTTSIHNLPNGVQFGLSRSELTYSGHTSHEFKTVDQFLQDLQIVTEMMGRVGQLPTL
jgi:predicted dipeptidase